MLALVPVKQATEQSKAEGERGRVTRIRERGSKALGVFLHGSVAHDPCRQSIGGVIRISYAICAIAISNHPIRVQILRFPALNLLAHIDQILFNRLGTWHVRLAPRSRDPSMTAPASPPRIVPPPSWVALACVPVADTANHMLSRLAVGPRPPLQSLLQLASPASKRISSSWCPGDT
jgi:hypothetical protein